jgi:hypothetical protein
MAIKAGTLAASAPGKPTTTISDGKRLRVIWESGDGDGDASQHLIDRTLPTVKGHPTWKLFCGAVRTPLVRDSDEEPPRYVYLDDYACHAIWTSNAYSKQELKSFWPFDFDATGKIKTVRKNRGRPAYVDESCTAYAQGTVRSKNKSYEFCGGPEEQDIKDEFDDEPSTPSRTHTRTPAQTTLPLTFPLSPIIPRALSPPPHRTTGNGRVPWTLEQSTGYIAGPADGSLLPLGMAHKAMQGSPYFDEPTALHRSRPRPRSGDLAAALGVVGVKRKAEVQVPEKIRELARVEAARKRRRASSRGVEMSVGARVKSEPVEELVPEGGMGV